VNIKFLKPIFIVGMMGTGKTLMAKKLGKFLKCSFVDLDLEISKSTDSNVKEIFEQEGEEKLRKVEFSVLQELIKEKHKIISIGDSLVNNQKAWNFILKFGIVIWLNSSLKAIFSRLKPSVNRPLFDENFSYEDLVSLFNQRKRRYQQAHIEIRGKVFMSKIKSLVNVL